MQHASVACVDIYNTVTWLYSVYRVKGLFLMLFLNLKNSFVVNTDE